MRIESYFLDVGLQYFPSAVYKVQMTKFKLTFYLDKKLGKPEQTMLII